MKKTSKYVNIKAV